MAGRPPQPIGAHGDEAARALIAWYARAFAESGFGSRQALADRAGVSSARVSEFFSGARFPSWPLARSLGAALGLDEGEAYRRWTQSDRVRRQHQRIQADQAGRGGPGIGTAPVLPVQVAQLLAAQQHMCSDLPYELFGADAPPLGDVYVRERVRAVEPGSRTEPGKVDASVVLPASTLVTRRPHAVVLGAPGSGKTSMIQRLVQQWSAAWLAPDGRLSRPPGTPWLVPLRIAATDLTGEGAFPTLLTTAVTRQVGGRIGFVLDPTIFSDRPAPGAEWLVCVDGLDEILDVALRRRVVQALRWRLANGGAHRFLITSRPLFLSEVRPLYESGAADCDLLPFDDDQVTMLAERWFAARHRPELAPTFLAEIARSPLRDDLTRVPLVATIAAVVHETSAESRLPMTRTGLFTEFVRYLLHVRPIAVQARHQLVAALAPYGRDAELLADWLYSNRRPLLAHVAAETLSRDDVDLAAVADAWTRAQAPSVPEGVPLRDQILPTLMASTGVVTTAAAGRPRFTHRSLAEFFAAPTLAARLGSDLKSLDEASRFLHSDHADYERLVLTLAAWASAPEHQAELLWQRLEDPNAWQTLLAGRVAVETGEHVHHVASRLIRQLGLTSMTVHGYGEEWEDTASILGQQMHRPEVVREVRALADAPFVHPARRTAALAVLARHCADATAADRIETLGRRGGAFAALCAADALIYAGATDRGLHLLTTVLRHADLPAGWIQQAGLRLINTGRAEDAVKLWKRWLGSRTPADASTQHLIADLAEAGEVRFARRAAQRLMRNSAARLDARIFASRFLIRSDGSEHAASDALAEEGRRFLRHIVDDPNQDVDQVIWVAEGMVQSGLYQDTAANRLRMLRDAPENAADVRFGSAQAVATLSAEDREAGRALLAAPPADTDHADHAWQQAAYLAADLGMDDEATLCWRRAAKRVNDSSAVAAVLVRLGERDPLAARAEALAIAACTTDDGVHYETVRLLLYAGWIDEACDHVIRHAGEPGIAPFWRNAIVGMTITAQSPDAALRLAAALSEVSDPDDSADEFWSRMWLEVAQDLQPLEDVLARAERWPPTGRGRHGNPTPQ
jgi:hypothetical protein